MDKTLTCGREGCRMYWGGRKKPRMLKLGCVQCGLVLSLNYKDSYVEPSREYFRLKFLEVVGEAIDDEKR